MSLDSEALRIPATAYAQTLWRISKMRQVSILIIILTIGCSNPKQTSEQTVSGSAGIPDELIETYPENRERQLGLSDTIINEVKIKFLKLTDKSFNSIMGLSKRTDIPLKSFDKKITKLDSCLTFKIDNGDIDSLCNMDDGEYFEKYLIKGFWEEKNLLLVNFQNWEEGHDFLINLTDGGHYILTPFYELSPSKDIIISYVDISAAPIYTSELILTKIEKGVLTTILQRDLGQTTITDAVWVSNNDCLITTGFVDFETDNMTDKRKYLIRIE